jgi:DNA-binding NarL/FixJ family response regulator
VTVSGPDAATVQQAGRPRPLRVRLDIADRVLRADTADACDDAGIAMADDGGEADVVLIDWPVATAAPAVALAADGTRRAWPASVFAVVPADIDAETLAAVITVVAAGYALTARGDNAGANAGIGYAEDAGARESGDESGDGDSGAEDSIDEDSRSDEHRALSAREREVLALLAGGASNKEIALALGLSVSTVKFHVAAIIGKLGARSRVDAVAIAVRAGLVMV